MINNFFFFFLLFFLSTFRRNELSPASDTISRLLFSIYGEEVETCRPSFFMSSATNTFITLALLI